MLRSTVARLLTPEQKRAFKSKVNEAQAQLARTFRGYGAEALKARVRAMGVVETDTLLVHSNFKPDSGFQGAPIDLVNALVELVGERGNLLMVSIPFRGAAYDYLALNKPFNVRKTLSMMGLATEMFRRRPGTLRSLHPTHPVLACGKDATWIVEGHEDCLFPCGHGSPFEKLRALQGKILFFDVGMEAITFFHYVEDLLKDRLPFPVYADRVFTAPVIDAEGRAREVRTYAFNKTIPRRADKLEAEMSRRGVIRRGRVGNSHLLLVTAEDVVRCQTAMVAAGNYPYAL